MIGHGKMRAQTLQRIHIPKNPRAFTLELRFAFRQSASQLTVGVAPFALLNLGKRKPQVFQRDYTIETIDVRRGIQAKILLPFACGMQQPALIVVLDGSNRHADARSQFPNRHQVLAALLSHVPLHPTNRHLFCRKNNDCSG